MLDRLADPLIRSFGSLDALPAEWRELLDQVQSEHERLLGALDRTTSELHELMVEVDALRRARSAAESTNLVRGEVLATVSRTMRTPADAISGLAGMLKAGALLPTQRAYVEAVEGAAESLRSILNEVSDFSRLEAGTLPLEPIPFDLRVMVEDLAATRNLEAQARGLSLRLAWSNNTPRRVTGDPGRIRQVLVALVRDAVTRMSGGEIVIEVSRGRLGSASGGVAFVVEDSGPGIPVDLLPTLFEPFSRGDVHHQRDGGLALPIARQLCRLMGGDLTAEAIEGAGTRFSALLPVPPLEERVSGGFSFVADETLGAATAEPTTHSGLIVVEADAEHRAGWAGIAKAAGYHATGCATRAEALAELRQRAEAGHPAVIVLWSDHDALGYDDVGRELLQDERFGQPAQLMLPAVGNPGDARRLREAGFRGYLVKPVAPTDLREALETLRRTPRTHWYTLFLTRHSLAEARRGAEAVPEVTLEVLGY